MSDEPIVGFLRDEGWEDAEIEEATGLPMDAPSLSLPVSASTPALAPVLDDRREVLRRILEVAQSDRRRPGKTGVVGGGVLRAAAAVPAAVHATPVRVDTEETFVRLRGAVHATDLPGDVGDQVLDELARAESRGVSAQDFFRHAPVAASEPYAIEGDGFYRLPVTHTIEGVDRCLLCNAASAPGGVCAGCRGQAVVRGFGERGAASEIYGAFGDRGAASEESLFGAFGDRGAASEESFINLVGDILSLEPASRLVGYDPIQLSFDTEDKRRNVAAWQRGGNLYSSIRVTGWDGEPRVLTATVPLDRAAAVVVGYAARAGIAPVDLLGVLEPLARQLGASSLIPILAASSPTTLHLARERGRSEVPFKVAVLPVAWAGSQQERDRMAQAQAERNAALAEAEARREQERMAQAQAERDAALAEAEARREQEQQERRRRKARR